MQELKNLIIEKIEKLYNLKVQDITLDNPPKKELWDFCFWPFLLSKDLKKSPAQISNELLEALKWETLIKDLNVAWPYLNIKLSNNIFKDMFLKAYNDFYAWFNVWNGKTIIVDYIWANVWKPLHIGHMCTPNQGQTIYNVYKKLWYNVIWDSHIWDWGIIFWKLIFAYKTWGEEEKLKENAVDYLLELYVKVTAEVEKDNHNLDNLTMKLVMLLGDNLPEKYSNWKRKAISIEHNFNKFKDLLNYSKDNEFYNSILEEYNNYCNNLEEQIRQEFKLLSEWNPESISLWQKFTRYSIDAMQVELDRLHVRPDFDIWESFYEWLWLPKMWDYPDLTYNMKDVVKELIENWIATKNEDGSVWVIFDESIKIPSCILQKRDGTHGYLASDLAAVKYRMQNFSPEKIVYFVDVRQQLHLKQVFEISKNAWWLNESTELFHAYNWFISWKEWAFSTRKWNIIKLKDLLDEAIDRAKKIILEKRQDFSANELEKLSEIIWIWAIKYWYLSKSRTTDVIFDWDEFMTFEGNSGPYIQYAYVRWLKILKKSWVENFSLNNLWEGNFETDEEIELVKELSNYKEILLKTANEYLPHILAWYSYTLTKKFNAFYNNVRVLEEEDEEKKKLKLMLVKLFLETLKDSFGLLWIEMPEEM